ncbi:MAG: DUF5675 family protein [Leadbetterella sp.]|nr:DUF5675 family protein [Leadbetterella sp.]
MELEILRTYYKDGTNGILQLNGKPFCLTIELPWIDNQQGISCIPEGKYTIIKRHSVKFDWHMQIIDVPTRELILIHPFNNALEESKGCIAPVSLITMPGEGLKSRIAFYRLRCKVFTAINNNQEVCLTIKKNEDETK